MYRIITFFLATILLHLATLLKAQPGWQVASSNYQYTMTVIGVAVFDCTESTDENDIVAAFINNEVRGVQSFGTDALGRKYAYLIVFDNVFSGNEVSFKMWDASEDAIVDVLATTVFSENGSVGGFDTPFLFSTETSPVDLSMTNETIAANGITGDPVADLIATDENGNTIAVTYSFIDDALGVDNGFFSLDGNTLILTEDVNADVKPTYQIHLAATAGNGCTVGQSFLLEVEGTTNILTQSDQAAILTTYPNPLAGKWLYLESTKKLAKARIYDATGRLIQENNIDAGQDKIDVSGLSNGLFLLLVKLEEGEWISTKLVVARRA